MQHFDKQQTYFNFKDIAQICIDRYQPILTPEKSQHSIIVLPAIGVPIAKYTQLIQTLISQQFTIVIADYPGCGRNQPEVSAQFDYGYRDLLTDFIPALIENLAVPQQQRPILLGHSLGGHLATLYALTHDVDVIGIATGNIGFQYWNLKGKINILKAVLSFKALMRVYGYLPGNKIGFGHKEAKTLMQDWCKTVMKGNYQHIIQAQAPIDQHALFIQLKYDQWAPLSSTLGLSQYFKQAQLRQLDLSQQIRGNQHSAWIKQPDAIVTCILEWLATYK